MKGKERCRILKEIRQRIADENEIPFVTAECQHKGDCLGTCPKCEAELAYLEREVNRRRTLGKAVTVIGLAVVTAVSGGCTMVMDLLMKGGATTGSPVEMPPSATESHGGTAFPAGNAEDCQGEPAELMGDVAYLPPPAIEHLTHTCTTEEDYCRQLTLCRRIDLTVAWQDYLRKSTDQTDTFLLPGVEEYCLAVSYDENGYVCDVTFAYRLFGGA